MASSNWTASWSCHFCSRDQSYPWTLTVCWSIRWNECQSQTHTHVSAQTMSRAQSEKSINHWQSYGCVCGRFCDITQTYAVKSVVYENYACMFVVYIYIKWYHLFWIEYTTSYTMQFYLKTVNSNLQTGYKFRQLALTRPYCKSGQRSWQKSCSAFRYSRAKLQRFWVSESIINLTRELVWEFCESFWPTY